MRRGLWGAESRAAGRGSRAQSRESESWLYRWSCGPGMSVAVRDFRKLRVWRAAHQLALDAYETSKRFPPDERFGLTAQMRRAALSIPTNIAEGAGRPTPRDYRRFLSISLGSINELQSLIMAAGDLEYLDPQQYQQLHDQLVMVRRMTLAFRNSLTDAP